MLRTNFFSCFACPLICRWAWVGQNIKIRELTAPSKFIWSHFMLTHWNANLFHMYCVNCLFVENWLPRIDVDKIYHFDLRQYLFECLFTYLLTDDSIESASVARAQHIFSLFWSSDHIVLQPKKKTIKLVKQLQLIWLIFITVILVSLISYEFIIDMRNTKTPDHNFESLDWMKCTV